MCLFPLSFFISLLVLGWELRTLLYVAEKGLKCEVAEIRFYRENGVNVGSYSKLKHLEVCDRLMRNVRGRTFIVFKHCMWGV
jgi:hypothetical protein